MTLSSSCGATIIGWGTALPHEIVTNADFEARLDTTDEWITERTGIRERRHGGTTAGLAVEAGRNALTMAGLTGADIDFILLATTTPDYQIPSTASQVQEELGIIGGACDVNAACSGFVYGLVQAHGLIAMGLKRVLLIGSETLAKVTDQNDRNTAILFGNGAGAVVLEAVEGQGQLLSYDLGSDGTAREFLEAPIGGYMSMVGKEVFRKAVTVMVDSAKISMADAQLGGDDIALVVPHQANIRIIEAACSRLNFPMDRVAMVLHRTGNTSSASIPLALVDALENGRVKVNDNVLLVGFGAGMSWASAIIRWTGHLPEESA
ncbi:MAG: beta-ketoacyl-ACP synthase III [Acidimicrobiales bacterium]